MNTSNTFACFSSLFRKRHFYCLMLLLLICTSVGAQVTIGSTIKPIDGALLDLKQYNSTTDGGANSNLGMLLPRVNLEEVNSLKPTVPNPKPADNPAHEGLVVFNMATRAGLCPGLYVWNSANWDRLHGTCQTMEATVESKYVLDGSDRYFVFSCPTAWTAKIDDPDGILDQNQMLLSGPASATHNFKLQFKVIPKPSTKKNEAIITFKDANGTTLEVTIVGEPVYLEITNPTWTAEVDADELTSVVTTNSIRTVKFTIPAGDTWLTASGKNLNTTSNTGTAQRTSKATAYLEGLESETTLKKDVNVTQDNMTISIEVHWALKRLFGLDNELATPPAPQIIDLTSTWTWGGFYEHSIYGVQDVIPAGETTATFTILTNSKQPLVFGTPGASGTSLSWVDAAEVPELVERVDGISKYKMSLHAQELSGTAGRTGNVKLKISGGLEKELSVVQAQLEFLTLQNPAPSGDAYFFVGDDGGPATGGFTMNIADLKESPEIKYAYVNKHYLDYATYDQATNKFNVKLTENNPAEAPYPEFDHGLKEARFIVLYQIKATGRWQGGLVMLAQIPDDDSFVVEVTLPESGNEDAVEIVELPEHVIDNVKVTIAEKDKSWLDIVVNEDDNNLEMRSLEMNLTGVDRVAEVIVSSTATQRNGKITETAYMKVKVVQEAIYLRSDEEVSGVGPDKGVYTITLTTNAAYKFVELEEIPASIDWLAAKIKVSILGPISVESTTLKPNLTSVSRKHTIVIFIENKKTGEKIKREINFVQPPMTFTLSENSWNPHHDGDAKTFTMSTNSLQDITPSTDKDWLTVAIVNNGSGSFTLDLDATPNITGAQRTGTVTLQIGDSPADGLTKTITVTQDPITVTLNPTLWDAPIAGGNLDVTITTNSVKTPTTTSDEAWVTPTIATGNLKLVATANTGSTGRNATVTVEVNGFEVTLPVTQAKVVAILTVNPKNWDAPVDGGRQEITATTNEGTISMTSSQPSWLTIDATDKKTMIATPNTTGVDRTATVKVSNGTLSEDVTVTQKAITLVVSPTTWAVPVGGASQAITVTTNSTPMPTVTAKPAWITSATVGADKKVTLVASANASATNRSGVVTINQNGVTKDITVTQVGVTLTVTPATWTVPVNGGEQILAIVSNYGTININDVPAWITVSADKLKLTASPNTTGADRSATLKVTNGIVTKEIAVTQTVMTLTVTPATWAVPVNGGSQVFTAITNHGTVTMTSSQAWLVKAADGKTFTVAANTTGATRSATITVSNGTVAMNKTVTVSQDAMTMTVTPATWVVPVNGGSQAFTAVTNHGTVTMTSSQAWLVKAADGKTFTVAANTTGATRSATITVSNGTPAMNKTVTVSQDAMTMTVTPATWAVPVNGGSQAFTAVTNHGTVTMTSSQAWLVKAADGKTFTVAANTTGATRSATITVSNGTPAMNKTVTVSQDAMTMTVTPATWAVPVNGGSQAFTAVTNHGTVTMTSSQAWLVKAADGKTFTVAANTTGATRSATITVSNGTPAMNKTVTVSQVAMTMTVTPPTWAVPVNGGSQAFTAVTNHGTVTMTSSQAWLVKAADGKTFTVAANTTGATRSATITVSNGTPAMNKTVTVSQVAMTMTVTPPTWVVPVNGGSQAFAATTNHGTATLTSNAAWLVKGTDGKTFTVAANTTGTARSTTITVSNGIAAMNRTVTVSQVAMTMTVTPPTWVVPVNGGSQAFAATTNHGTATLTSNAAWLVKGTDGKTFTVAANTTGAARSTTITVSNGIAAMNKTVTVSQVAMTMTVTPPTWVVPVNGGSQAFAATTNHGTATLTSNAAWLVKGTDGKTFTVAANTTGAARSTTITVSNGIAAMNKTVTVSQVAMTMTVTPPTWAVPVNGGSQAFAATTNYGTATLTSNAAWLVKGTDGKTFTVAANTTGATRSTTITVSNGIAAMNKTVTVSQVAMTMTVTPPTWVVPVNGGSQAFAATTNHGTATLTSNAAWLVKAADGKTFTVAANITGATRSATITVTNGVAALNKTVAVTQAPVTLTVQPTWNPPAAGEDIILQTSTNYGVARIDAQASWASWLRKSFDDDSKFLSALPNTTGVKRTATVIVTNGLLTRSVLITQEPAAFTVNPALMTMSVDGQTQTVVANRPTITMRSNMGNVGWVTCNNAAKTITAAANNGTTERTAVVTVTAPGGETKQITIKQPGLYIKWATAADGAAIKLGDAGGSTARKYLTNTNRALESVIVNNANSTVNGSVYQLAYPLSIVNGVYTVQFRPQAIGVPYAQRGAIRSSTAAVRIKGTTVQTAAFTASQDKNWLTGNSTGTSFATNKLYLLQTLSNVDVMKTVETPLLQRAGKLNFGSGMSVSYVYYYNQATKQWAVKITNSIIPSNIASASAEISIEIVAARPNSFVWQGNGASPLRTTLKINWKKGNKSAFDNENITFTAPTSDEELHLSATEVIQVEVIDPVAE